MRTAFLIVLLLLAVQRPSLAVDEDLNTQLEKIASRDDGASIVSQLQEELFVAANERCNRDDTTNLKDCLSDSLADFLDERGTLSKHCGKLDASTRSECIINGAAILPIVTALGGDTDEDIDWNQIRASHSWFQHALKEAGRQRCEARGAATEECLVLEQAALLGFSPKAAKLCSQKSKYNKIHCLEALKDAAVYLPALRRAIGKSKSL